MGAATVIPRPDASPLPSSRERHHRSLRSSRAGRQEQRRGRRGPVAANGDQDLPGSACRVRRGRRDGKGWVGLRQGEPSGRLREQRRWDKGGKECPYNMFHHPDPTNMASRYSTLENHREDIPQQNVQASSQLNFPVWSADKRALNEHCAPVLAPAPSYSAGMVPPWGVYPSPEWSRYHQVPLGPYYPAGISFHHFPAPPLKYRGADVPGPEYPERPGQPECQHFVKTGFCKFRAKCIFHHPRSAGPLSPLGQT